MESLIIVFLVLLIFGGIFMIYMSNWWGLIFLLLGIVLLTRSFVKIKASPAHVGLVTVWGELTNQTKNEGWRLIARYFPFLYDVIQIEVTKKNRDFKFKNVRCVISENVKTDASNGTDNIRSGGSVQVIASITWIPDSERLTAYVKSGMQTGVEAILEDRMAEVIRQMGRTQTWEQMTFATEVMSANLIIQIVGTDLVNDDGHPWGFGETIEEKDVEEALKFLSISLKNGVADDHDLGVKIRRLNVKQVEPEGELQKDAEKSAQEVQQKRAEVFELETELELSQNLKKAYQNAATPKTLEECILEVRRRKVMREGHGKVIDIAGISPEMIAAASQLIRR